MAYVTSGIKIPSSADDELKKWFERIREGIKLRETEAEDWQKNEQQAYSLHEEKTDNVASDTFDITDVNKTASWLEARSAALSFRRPRVKLVPQTREGWIGEQVPVINKQTGQPEIDPQTGQPKVRLISRFKVLETVVNNIISKPSFGLAATIRRIVKGGLLASVGACKTGYTADFYDIGDDDIPPIPADQIIFMDQEYLLDKYEYEDGVPVINSDGMLVPKGLKPISEQWFIDSASHKKMIFDPDGENDFTAHGWVACEYNVPLDQVKADKRYKNTKDLVATGIKKNHDRGIDWQAPLDERTAGRVRDDTKIVTLFECWDFNEKKLYTVADGHDEFLEKRDFPDGVDETTGPWSFFKPTERTDEWYGTAPANDLRRIDLWLTLANQQVLRDMRKSALKALYRKGKIDSDDVSRLIDPQDRAIGIDDDSEAPFEQIVSKFIVGGVNPGTLAMKNEIASDFNERAGQPPAARGSAEADTAAEVKSLTAYDQLREGYVRGILRECLVDALQKLTISVKENMTIDQYVEIVGDDGDVFSIQVNRDMLKCDVNVEVDIADLTPLDDNARGARAVQALTLYSQQPLLGMDEDMNNAMLDLLGIKDERIARGLVKTAQMQLQMMVAEKQPQKPSTGPPQDDSQAASQQGGQ